MALIKCTECGCDVSDKAEVCPHCGAPIKPMLDALEQIQKDSEKKFEENINVQEERPPVSKKKMGVIIACLIILVGAAITYFQLTKDEEAPAFSGIDEGQTIEVQCGTDFNLKDYLSKNLKVTDNKDGDISEYIITTDENVYDSETGAVDTKQSGTFDVSLEAKDKADNASTLSVKLQLNPVHITKKNVKQTVYDGKYGTIKLSSFKHGVINGEKVYEMQFECTNKDTSIMEMFCSSTFTYINDYQVSAYVQLPNTIASGKTKTLICTIQDGEIPDDAGEFKSIETAACMAYEGADGVEDFLVRVPLVLDIDAAEQV